MGLVDQQCNDPGTDQGAAVQARIAAAQGGRQPEGKGMHSTCVNKARNAMEALTKNDQPRSGCPLWHHCRVGGDFDRHGLHAL